jgi:hypothetical protein
MKKRGQRGLGASNARDLLSHMTVRERVLCLVRVLEELKRRRELKDVDKMRVERK